jgi:hypothetical protein
MTQSAIRRSFSAFALVAVSFSAERLAHADDVVAAAPAGPEVKVSGWIETYYLSNFNGPSNGINSVRAFDFHDGFNLQNAAVDVDIKKGADSLKVTLQSGNLGVNTYDPLEPASNATAYTAATGPSTLRYVQQAYAAHAFDNGLTVTGGLFATPVGFEGYNVKDNWNWSRANTFYMLTYYHVGAKAAYALSKEFTATAYVMNGWNNGFETNATPSGAAQISYDNGAGTTASLVYLVGNERKRSDAADFGKPLRHLVDAWVSVPVNDTLSLGLHGDVGMETNKKGDYSWLAAAAYARAKVASWAYLAARADYFTESMGDATSPIFFLSANGTKAIGSGTLTLDLRPTESTSFRLEARHDVADGEVFFKRTVAQDSLGNDVFNAKNQTTLTLGMNTVF